MDSEKQCCVPSCKRPRSPGTPLHGFPNPVTDPERFRSWIYWVGGDILALDNQIIYKYRHICRRHFESKYLLSIRRLSNIAIPTIKIPDRRGKESKNINVQETQKSNVIRKVETLSVAPPISEGPLMVDQGYAMDIEITTEEAYDELDQQNSADGDGAEARNDGGLDHNFASDSDEDYHLIDDHGDSDEQTDDGLPDRPSSSTKSLKLTTSQPAAKQITIPPKPTAEPLTAKPISSISAAKAITNILSAQHITKQPISKVITNLPTSKVIINQPTDKVITNQVTAKVIANRPTVIMNQSTSKPITNPSTAKLTTSPVAKASASPTGKNIIHIPTTKLIKVLTKPKLQIDEPTDKSTANLSTARHSASFPGDKLLANLSTANTTTSLSTTNLPTPRVSTSISPVKLMANLSTPNTTTTLSTTNLPAARLSTSLSAAKLMANLSTPNTTTTLSTTNLNATRFSTSLSAAKLMANLSTANTTTTLSTTNLPTARVSSSLSAAKLMANLSTANTTTTLSKTNLPTTRVSTSLSAAKLMANLSTANTTITLSKTNLPTARLSTSLSAAKLMANLSTANTRTTLSADQSIQTELQPELKTPAKVSLAEWLRKTYGKDMSQPPSDFGYCRCCLMKGTHSVTNVPEVLECLNIKPSTDPRFSVLVCAECCKFLEQARKFRDMVAATERIMLSAVNTIQSESDTPPTPSFTDSKIKIPLSSLNLSVAQPLLGGAKKRRVVVLNESLDKHEPGDECTEDSNELAQAEGEDFEQSGCDLETAGEVTIPMEETADDGAMLDDRPFSQSSEYSEFGTDIREEAENLNDEDYYKSLQALKSNRTKLAGLIRENLIMLLECSTIIPFDSTKGVLFDCIYCDSSYPNINQLKLHMEEKHVNKTNDSKYEILKIIRQSIIRADISCIKCRLCDKRFATIDNLVQHLVAVHNKKYHDVSTDPPHNILCFDLSLKDWKCLACDKIFPSFKKLRIHVNQHYGSYLCYQCGSKFLYPNTYSKHMQDHQKIKQEKKHTCDTCGDTFKTKKELAYHTNRAHFDDKLTTTWKRKGRLPKPLDEALDEIGVYECNLCSNGTTLTSKFAAYVHRIQHVNNAIDGPFHCDQCNYMSPKKNNIRQHLKIHYGIRRFVCDVCNKKYLKKSKLIDHMHKHLNLRYQCPLCDTTLSNKGHVKRHVKNRHPGVTVDFS